MPPSRSHVGEGGRRSPGYRARDLPTDLLAGGVLFLTAVPESLAFTQLAGLPLAAGLWVLIVPPLTHLVFGGSRRISLGVTASVAAIVAESTTGASPAAALARASAIALTVAVLFACAGVLRLGFLTRLVSRPILSGLSLGMFVVLVTYQLGDLLGIEAGGRTALQRLGAAWGELRRTSLPTLALGFVAVALYLGFRRAGGRAAAGVAAIAGTTLAAAWLGWSIGGEVRVVGALETGLPRRAWTELSVAAFLQALPAAAAIFVLLGVESMGLGRGFALRAGERFRTNRELLALSAANTAAALSSTLPVGGSASATVMSEGAGGRTAVAEGVAAALAALLLVLGHEFRHLPRVALAVVSIAAFGTLLRPRVLVRVARFDARELALAVVAFTATVGAGPMEGALLATGLSLLLFLRGQSEPRVVPLPEGPSATAAEVLRVRHEGALLSLNAEAVAFRLQEMAKDRGAGLRRVVVDLSAVPAIDFTAADVLHTLRESLAGDGVCLSFSGGTEEVVEALARAGLDAAAKPSASAAGSRPSPGADAPGPASRPGAGDSGLPPRPSTLDDSKSARREAPEERIGKPDEQQTDDDRAD